MQTFARPACAVRPRSRGTRRPASRARSTTRSHERRLDGAHRRAKAPAVPAPGAGMSRPLVVVDADVLGRRRTGDETYVENLLRALPEAAPDLRFAAITRRPDLVPDGVEAVELSARSQEFRMAVRVPLLLRRLRPQLAHFVHSLPLGMRVPAVLTVQDLSFERDASLMGARETAIFASSSRARRGGRDGCLRYRNARRTISSSSTG